MKILISDFDGTLFVDDNIPQEAVQKIQEFRNNGNVFIISTARNYSAVKKDCLKYGVSVDYFFCDIGSVILDNEGNIIYTQFINEDDINIIESTIEKYQDLINVKRYNATLKHDNFNNNIVEYKIDGNTEILKEIKNALSLKSIKAKIQITEDNKLIIHTGTKEEIIQFFINQNNIDKSIITTIGDELDDLNMLKLYNGYRMEQCNEKVRQNIKKSVKSVAELINFII